MVKKKTTRRNDMVPIKTGQETAINLTRDNKGRFTKGNNANPTGRPLGTGKAGKLARALEEYETKANKSFVEHYFNLAFEDPATARDLAGRLYPALKAVEGRMDVRQKILQVFGMEPISHVTDTPK